MGVYDKRLHRNLRARLNKDVQHGDAYCMEVVCIHPQGRWIQPGTPWHLAHHRASGTYLGPAHATCNTSEAGRYASRSRTPPAVRAWRSRSWGGTPTIANAPRADDPARAKYPSTESGCPDT